MQKSIIPIFFSIVFFVSITAPSVIIVMDNSYDISFVENIAGEEENKESSKDLETEIFYNSENTSLKSIVKKNKALRYFYKKYNSISQELFLPPPERVTV